MDSQKKRKKAGGRASDKFSGTAFDVDFSALSSLDNEDGWIRVKESVSNLFKKQELLEPMEPLSEIIERSLSAKTLMHSIMVKSLVTMLSVELQTFWLADLANASTDNLYDVLRDRWLLFFGTVLPFVQGIFSPLDRKLAGRQNSLTVQKIGLAAFRDGLLLSDVVKKNLMETIAEKGNTLPPRILQMVEILKRIQTCDKNEIELNRIFAKTQI